MASRKFKLISASGLVLLAGAGVLTYSLIAAQAQGPLAQAPLNNQVQTPPAFIMAVDDSGSMNFQTQFPGMDGEGCWNTSRKSFFNASGQLNTSGNCDYFFVLPGPRINNYYGIPPLDSLGFARSAEFNPTYFNPTVKYDPWIDGNGVPYGNASLTATKIDPRGNDTVQLASNYYRTASWDTFLMQDGMVIPANTPFRYNNRDYEYNYDYTWSGAAANVYMQYWPATYYVRWTSNSDPYPQLPGTANAYNSNTRVRVSNACGTGCDMWRYRINANDTVALQNFANWFSYYGNRNRAMIAGMTRSLSSINNLRVGYLRINQNGNYNTAAKRLTMRDMAVGSDKVALYNEMTGLTASGGTPNRQAVYSAGIQFTRTDAGAPIQLACQKNAVMLFTDGYSNGDGPQVGNNDGNMTVPFKDGHSNTMADIASFYYNSVNGGSPLRTDMQAGQVPVPEACSGANPDPKLDCQANLHVNFYGVTLGARGNLFNPDLNQNPYTDASIYGNWPVRENDQRSTVDDIWHASVNTRGEYINARTPADITSAMRRVLSSVTSGASASGSYAQTGARIGTGSMTVVPAYKIANEGTDWFSTLTAATVSVNQADQSAVTTTAWEASTKLPAAGSRNIFFGQPSAVRAFSSTNVTLDNLCEKSASLYPGMSRCTAAELSALGATAATAVNYLRGDATQEVRNRGTLRDRTSALGDIINSTPLVSSPIDDYGYRSLGGATATSYATYLATKRASARYMVYVGANDGMLHAFDGGMGASGVMDTAGGVERFAYIPMTALGHMGNLLFPYDARNLNDQKFAHRYYVDGPVTVSDALIGASWSTVLVGAAGAGGRGVFALDVTNPAGFGANSRLWEISDLNTTLPQAVRDNIGHVLGKPVIVPVKTAGGVISWKAIFGNGYNSASGKAVLFLVDIGTGSPNITMIEAAETGNNLPAGSNGLGNILTVDRWNGAGLNTRGRDGYTDTVYAADQKGALWKFDLRSTSTALSVPLFTTQTSIENGLTYRQPITGGLTATNGRNGGVMLFFGTGSFSFTADASDKAVQSLYGVNDTVQGPITSTLTRANLQPYTLGTINGVRTTSAGTVPTNSRGWSVNLPAGERFVAYPNLATGVVFMPTYVPNPVSAGCSSDGANWLFGLDALTGAPALSNMRQGSPTGPKVPEGTAAIALNTPGTAPVRNVGVQSLPRQPLPAYSGGGGSGGNNPPPPPPSCQKLVNTSGAAPLYGAQECGRQSWRQIQ